MQTENNIENVRGFLPWLQLAINEAQKSNYIYRHGCIVLYKGRPVGKGYNQLKSNPTLKRKYGYFSLHAECKSLMKTARGDTLIVVRILKNGTLTMSRPCERCIRFAKDFGIRKIIYSDWDQSIKQMKVA